ncbi:MAG: efflux transporter outer membrane subunit [Burkholderiaceae bacterium]
MSRRMALDRFPLVLALGAMLLSGCAGRQITPAAELAIPTAWRTVTPAGDAITDGWWRSFGSPELDRVIQQALAGSNDLAASIARVHQAAAQARIAGAGLWPAIDAQASASRQTGGAGDVLGEDGKRFATGLSASYEIDFWGRNRAIRDAAEAALSASEYDHDTVRLTIVAGAASLWMQTVGLRERAAIAVHHLDLARQTLELVQAQARAGAASPLDLAQQRGLVANQQRIAATLRQAARESEASLAAWLGLPVERLTVAAASLHPVAVPSIDAGLPSALLARRPDVARAESRLRAADANIAAARAALLPNLTLSAGAGFSGGTARTLFDAPLYNIAAGLTAPIFDGGRLRGARDLAIAQREELLADYRAAIVAAFADVDKALEATTGLDEQSKAQDEALIQARHAQALAQSRYRAGAETMLTVLATQQTLFAAQDLEVQLKQARLQAVVALYQALGGGWQVPSPPARDRYS